MGYSLRPETMDKISMAQEPTNLSADSQERNDIQEAKWLIKSGIPKLVRQGRRKLIRICLRSRKAEELTELGAYLLCERRKWFIKRLKEINNVQSG